MPPSGPCASSDEHTNITTTPTISPDAVLEDKITCILVKGSNCCKHLVLKCQIIQDVPMPAMPPAIGPFEDGYEDRDGH